MEKKENNMTNWVKDINLLHDKFGVYDVVEAMDKEKLYQMLLFKKRFLDEELAELQTAIEEKKPENIVDALIDLCVVAIGTLDVFNIDSKKAWDIVQTANMSKLVGVNASRPNTLGLPDLIKPEGWVSPSHKDNIGLLECIF